MSKTYNFDDEHIDALLDNLSEKEIYRNIINITSLPTNLKYYKLINIMEAYLNPMYNFRLKLDYDSAKMILAQGKEINSNICTNKEKKLLFILMCVENTASQKIFIDENFNNSLETLASISDPVLYQRVVNRFQNSLDLEQLFVLRRQYIENILSSKSYNNLDCNMFREHNLYDVRYFYDARDYNELHAEDSVNLYFKDLIAQYFFDDIFDNAWIDINQIVKYTNKVPNNLINGDMLDFYHDFLLLKDNTLTDKLLFFYKYRQYDLRARLYDDIRTLKDHSYDNLIDSCTSFDKSSPLYNRTLSDKYGAEIYYLDGEEFYGFVRSNVTVSKYNSDEKGLKCYNRQPTKEEINRLSTSFSYIGTQNIQTYKHPNKYLTLLYTGINPHCIEHVYHDDSWSYGEKSDAANELHTPESLLSEAPKYPEITIANFDGIKPSGLICLDEVTDWDLEFSRENNIPIILINSEKYERKYYINTENNYFNEPHYFR